MSDASKSALYGKVVVVTGASGGLGRVVAREFGQLGAKVVLLARGMEGLNGARNEVEANGGEALVVQTDVSDAEQVEIAAQKAEEHFGPIDIWVNNAMNSVFAPMKDVEPDEFKRVIDVTLMGQVYGTMAALKRMLPRNNGTIILVGSALAYRGIPLQSAYCCSKHGIQGFFDSLRCELAHDKSEVKLTMIQLPAMNTTQFGWVRNKLPNKARPMGKVYEPEVAAKAIVFACLPGVRRRSIWVGYPTFQSILDNKIWPAYLDRYLGRNGYKGQQTSEPKSPDAKDNLWAPVHEDRGAYGGFANISTPKSSLLWISMHRNMAIATIVLLVLIAVVTCLVV